MIGRLAKPARLASSWGDAQFTWVTAEIAAWAVDKHCLIVVGAAREVNHCLIAVGACYDMLGGIDGLTRCEG